MLYSKSILHLRCFYGGRIALYLYETQDEVAACKVKLGKRPLNGLGVYMREAFDDN
ncbi:hypothetical protein [Propionigenium maris]|uniref:hypothetical protein n=1 Tax=Propionigenium maris TaxID=45622 RepID=UPI002493C20E|nr:hypothetical protein [Propionigenium maris]